MITHEEFQKMRDHTVDALVKWAKTGKCDLAARYQTNRLMEASGANDVEIGGREGIIAHRRMCADQLAIHCITQLSNEQLSKVEKLLERIVVDDAPMPRRNRGLSI